jgi:hypothetical protein
LAEPLAQIDATHAGLKLPGRKVLIKHLADGKLIVEHQAHRLSVRELPSRPQPARTKKPVVNNVRWKPRPRHPWNAGPAGRAAPPPNPAPATPARGSAAEKRKKAG